MHSGDAARRRMMHKGMLHIWMVHGGMVHHFTSIKHKTLVLKTVPKGFIRVWKPNCWNSLSI